MKRRVFFGVLVTGLVALAAVGWSQGPRPASGGQDMGLTWLVLRADGVRDLALSLVRTDGKTDPGGMGKTFGEQARRFLAEEYPSVEMEDGDIQPVLNTWGEVVAFKVQYTLAEGGLTAGRSICLDVEGNARDGAC